MQRQKPWKNRTNGEISKLIAEAESYIKEHFDEEYYKPVKASCELEKVQAKEKYNRKVQELKKEHEANLAGLSDAKERKDENYVYKNRLFDAKLQLQNDLQAVKDRRHEAFSHKYHLIDPAPHVQIYLSQNPERRNGRTINIHLIRETSYYRMVSILPSSSFSSRCVSSRRS